MNTIIILLFLLIIILIIIATLIFSITKEKNNKEKTRFSIQEALELKNFFATKVIYINKFLSIATNKNQTKLAIVKNFNPNNPTDFNLVEIASAFIEKIENNFATKIYYRKKGELDSISIYPANDEIKNFIHEIYLKACIKKIESKYPQENFSLYTSSDWACNYVWAYNPQNSSFAYFKTDKTSTIFKINLKKEHFTIDTKYKYFEAPIEGIQQQLEIYDKNFLQVLYDYIFDSIKTKCNEIAFNSIYYESFNNIIYLSNGSNSLQSIILNKIDEVYYQDYKLSFTLKNEDKMINFIANSKLINDFEDFMTNLNLQKIAQNFDTKSDKLINTTPYTKFIIDFSRDRFVYCANLNKFASFSYLTIPFFDVKNATVEKSGTKFFVRLTTRNKDILDITCDKKEVAQYIEALIVKKLG